MWEGASEMSVDVLQRDALREHEHLQVVEQLRDLERRVLVYRVVAAGTRRGPAEEARRLYEDLTPPAPQGASREAPPTAREPGSGRPTKKERRETDRFRSGGQ